MHGKAHGVSLFLLSLILALGVFMGCQAQPSVSKKPWPETVLEQSWQFYKQQFLVEGSHVRSSHYGGTITEGQSYAMAKALYHNDKPVFDAVWRWTKKNMKRPNDNLLGWRWGQKPNGAWGLLEIENASDADEDMAYYLLIAGKTWNRPDYITDAKALIGDIGEKNLVSLKGKVYLTPGTWSGFSQPILTLNPSYTAPYIYRAFAIVDPKHPWAQLANDSMDTLAACSNLTRTKLPPNWCGVMYKTGAIVFSDVQGDNARDFSWDAVRVFWRMAWDAQLGNPKAKQYSQVHSAFLKQYFQVNKTLPVGFTASGQPLQSPGVGGLSAWVAAQQGLTPTAFKPAYEASLGQVYSWQGAWQDPNNNFLQDLAWFALAQPKWSGFLSSDAALSPKIK